MSQAVVQLKQRGWGKTMRRDAWWSQSLAVFLVFSGFLVYANFRIFDGDFYHCTQHGANYLAPFYSPLLFDNPAKPPTGHAWFAHRPDWIPNWVTAAMFILIFPAGFRFTCYYYRGAYYKAFWQDPPSCAVSEPRNGYRGEAKWPLLIQNIHRYFLYAAIVFVGILSYDAWLAMWFEGADGKRHFGLGVGTILMVVNVVLIALYTFGCHSLRHLIGGKLNVMSAAPLRHKAWSCVTCLNSRHMLWAWMSLFSVGFTDFYIRMCAKGDWHDWRLF